MEFNATGLDWSNSGSTNEGKYGKLSLEGHGGPYILRPRSLSPNLYGSVLPVRFCTGCSSSSKLRR